MKKFIDSVAQKPFLVLASIIALSLIFVLAMGKYTVLETNLDAYMPSTHPAFVYSDEAEEIFGINDAILFAVEHPDTIYNSGTLEKIKRISEELAERFEEIEFEDVTSLYTAENITSDEWGLTVESFYTDTPETGKEIEALQNAVRGNDMINGRIVSADEKSTLIIADIGDDAFSNSFYDALQEFAAEWEGPETIHIAGRPIVEGELTRLGPKDMARMAPLVIILMTIILLFLLKSVRHTILNLIIVLFGTLTAFGAMALLRVPVYTLSTMIPVMLIAIGVADGIHMHNTISSLIEKKPDIKRKELVHETLREMIRPVIMTSITTAAGFMSLLTSDVLPVRYFGLFTALGVLMEMVMALVLFPASIYLFGPISRKKISLKKSEAGHGTFAGKFGNLLLKRPRIVITAGILISLLAIASTSRVWIDTSFLANFEDDSRIVQTDKFVNDNFGGTSTLNIIFESPEYDTFKQPEVLELMDEIQNMVEQDPMVGDSFSVSDYIRRMHRVMHEDDPAYDAIPETSDMVAQYLLLYEMSGDPDNLNVVVDYDYRFANMTLQLKSDSSAIMETVIDTIEPYKAKMADHGITINYAGSGYKSFVFATLLLEGQILSLLLSFGIVALLLTLLFRNVWLGLAGAIPITITAMVNFGIMGLLGIPLSSSTAIISSIAIGIGADYAIHLIEHYRTIRRNGMEWREATLETLGHTGKAIVYNAIAVMGGFAVMLVSVFPPNRQVGGLIALNMAVSAIGTLTLLLIVIVALDRKGRI
jgi:predicted RND superfamily exporter protein